MSINIKEVSLEKHPVGFLTHWTGRDKLDKDAFEILKLIIETKSLKFNSNKIAASKSGGMTIDQQMICFTNTPIQLSKDLCNKFGYCGISFKRDELIKYGANPVLYLTENRLKNRKFLSDLSFPTENEKAIHISWFLSMTQENKNYFYQKEWRIVRVLPFPTREIQEKIHGLINEVALEGTIKIVQKADGTDESFYLFFDSSIIENIIVPDSFRQKAIDLMNAHGLTCDLVLIKDAPMDYPN
jgi:hypothetical protein